MNKVSGVQGRNRKNVGALRGAVAASGAVVAIAASAGGAWAQEPYPTVPAVASPAVVAEAPAPPPYSLPWQLRPAGVANIVRADSSLATYEAAGETGFAAANLILASYKVTPTFAPIVRLAVVYDQRPGADSEAGAAFVNPILGAAWAPKLEAPWRLAVFGGAALPLGMGGGDDPKMDATAAAASRGIPVRSAMDNAMFAVNYLTPIAGVDVAWVAHGLTLQAEATVLQLVRVRNEMYAPEAFRTNSTFGLHAGYFVMPFLSIGSDLRYQRWLSTPAAVSANPAARDTLTLAFGPRGHFKFGAGSWLRPGVSYTWAIDDPVAGSKYRILQVDVPLSF